MATSIQAVGLLHPIVVTPDNQLIAGRRRLEAYRHLGRDDIPARVVRDLDEARRVLAESDENTCRKDLSPSEAVAQAEGLEKLATKDAKERQGGPGRDRSSKLDEQSRARTDETVAAAVGMKKDTFRKARAVVQAARKDPGTFGPVAAEMDRTGRVEPAHRKIKEHKRQERRKANAAQVKQTSGTLEELLAGGGKFATIMLDPPWDWGDEGDCDQLGRAKPTYETMPIGEVEKLPVGRLADDDCHLYLWITNRSLPKGFRLLDAWGFRYITCLTWCKPSFGMGNYFRGSTEQILFGVKGSQPLKRKDAGTWFQAKRGKDGHSSKPTEAYELVESCSPGPYLEMFARQPRPRWTTWGAES